VTGVSTEAPPSADQAATPPTRGRALGGARAGKGRGRRQHALLRLRGDIPMAARVVLGIGGGLSVILFWLLAAALWSAQVPTPGRTFGAGVDLWQEGELWPDLVASTMRVAQGYAISLLIGVVLGIAIGSYRSIEAYWEAPIGFLRYVPATALTPLFLVWLGIDEAPKIALIVVGTVFYNVLMIADVARNVPREMVTSAYTLGAGRLRVLRRVILPHSWPGIVDVARINLAAAWLMLVVAELLAADDGLAAELTRAYRFRRVDTMFAILVVFGIIGVASDLILRWVRNRTAPWARS
jgi:NitT/TauT family transport system permease protein